MRYDYYIVLDCGYPTWEIAEIALTRQPLQYCTHRIGGYEQPTVYTTYNAAQNAIRRQRRYAKRNGMKVALGVMKITIPWNGMESA